MADDFISKLQKLPKRFRAILGEPTPLIDDALLEAARKKAREAESKRRGRRASILSGTGDLGDLTSYRRPQLLGTNDVLG